MEVRGVLSSWLTVDRELGSSRSCSETSAISYRVTTIDSTAPSSVRMGRALSNTVTFGPFGTPMTTSSARTFTAVLKGSAMGELPQGDFRAVGPLEGHNV